MSDLEDLEEQIEQLRVQVESLLQIVQQQNKTQAIAARVARYQTQAIAGLGLLILTLAAGGIVHWWAR